MNSTESFCIISEVGSNIDTTSSVVLEKSGNTTTEAETTVVTPLPSNDEAETTTVATPLSSNDENEAETTVVTPSSSNDENEAETTTAVTPKADSSTQPKFDITPYLKFYPIKEQSPTNCRVCINSMSDEKVIVKPEERDEEYEEAKKCEARKEWCKAGTFCLTILLLSIGANLG